MTADPQLPLFPAAMAEQFEQFHTDNPDVYRILVQLAHQWITRTGSRKLGIATLYERTRWQIAVATSDPNYKLNNNFRAFYARLIMCREPALAGMFDLRESVADEWLAGYVA